MLQSNTSDIFSGGRQQPPLCVDLDETLVRTDILWESIVQLWHRPLVALRAVFVLATGGKATLKSLLAHETLIDPSAIPYRDEVLEFARLQALSGREVVLATATHVIVAEAIAKHLGFFNRVFATNGSVNLSGIRKRDALTAAYGKQGYDYVGDSRKDLPVFSSARQAMLVAPSPSLRLAAAKIANVTRVFEEDQVPLRIVARALRLHQWAKNALLAVPLLAAHMVFSLHAWISITIAFLGFGLVASATYLINDLVDLDADRRHEKKRFRPLASGRLSIPNGLVLVLTLATTGFFVSASFLPLGFVAYLMLYVALTLTYSFDLKRRLLVDVIALALLYTLRILAGGVAIGVVVSEWLLMFSLFIFFSLAFLKRFIELRGKEGSESASGRGYSPLDIETIRTIGVSSGLMSVLVFSLYISNPVVSHLYRSPQVLWLMCPLLIYWISRIWFLAARGEVHHDPVVFALLDWRSYLVGAFSVVIVSLAKIGPIEIHW
jgi:4-hydroxybenzoate polyprenyltransferase/phosphoserine phosphatase